MLLYGLYVDEVSLLVEGIKGLADRLGLLGPVVIAVVRQLRLDCGSALFPRDEFPVTRL
jgi:hypothetical protein